MRDIQQIWDTWRSGRFIGDARPSTRLTVEPSFWLRTTGSVVGQWDRGPARWFQRAELDDQVEIEIPGVVSVNMNRSVEPDAGTCDIVIRNTVSPDLVAPEVSPGQFGDPGYYTPERGESQDANARWGHAINPWHGILAPNALLRTYQGFGGHDKTVRDAVTDGDVVLNGVWLVDDVSIGTDGTMSVRCRDMAKLLIDQQLIPPLVPTEFYPLEYRRYRIETYTIPAEPPPYGGRACADTYYPPQDASWHSSSDEAYGAYNATNTGHPPTDAYDMSPEPGPGYPGYFAHQRTFWLSEPKASPGDSVWIEMEIPTGSPPVNEIYCHPWRGWMEGKGLFLVMVSVEENGTWVAAETPAGGTTAQGIPYVTTFVPGIEEAPGQNPNRFPLPRDYHTTRIRLTWTNLIWADDFPHEFVEGGFRAGARKLIACWNVANAVWPPLCLTGGSIPVNTENRYGYWQVRTDGRIYAFGDARVYPPGWGLIHTGQVLGMAIHPDGTGYWTIDNLGRIVSAGDAQWYTDPFDEGRNDWTDVAPTPSGNGYWALARDGRVYAYGDATSYGWSSHTGTHPDGVAAHAHAIESHPTTQGYWVLWSDGYVDAFNLTHYGNANQIGFFPLEWVTAIRRTSTGAGYRILSGLGRIQVFGDATSHGNATAVGGYDSEQWYRNLYWEILPSSSTDAGYLLQRADGGLSGHGEFNDFGSVGAGQGELRYDGNYKDYTDIIRDLLLWAGFYLYRNPQPEGELPDVYGNLETTGAYCTNDPLPQDMFDKRPVLDAIRDLKAIVGYAFFIDAEGGARWEAPNWWQMGNFLIDGTPFSYMPEIDERVQLTSHSVVRSAAAARSEIIIATEYPYSTTHGQPAAEGIIKTRIVGSTANDLKGIVSPAIWHNGEFLNPDEQKTMAELLDMQIWFQRRTAQVQCVANPLIDVNDQVRIIERQTGDVYIHYIKAISFSHDVQSGQFTMSLTTHWLGGTPYGELRLFYACAGRPQGDGYWQIAANGDVQAFGAADVKTRRESDTHLAWPIAMRSTPSGEGYWSLDKNGKILSYGDAVNYGDLKRETSDVVDFAITPTGAGYWILLQDGNLYSFGDALYYGNPTVVGVLPNGVAVRARSIESHPSTMGYWITFTDGTVHAYNLTHHGNANRDGYTRDEYVTRLHRTPTGAGYWVVSTTGIVQAFGDAADWGDAIPYPDSEAQLGMVWDFITDPAGGYGLQHADGTFEMFEVNDFGLARANTYALSWALVTQDAHSTLPDPAAAFPVSGATIEFLKNTGSPSANNAATNQFNSPTMAALEGTTT